MTDSQITQATMEKSIDVLVLKPTAWGNSETEVKINWGGLGSVSIEDAERFRDLLNSKIKEAKDQRFLLRMHGCNGLDTSASVWGAKKLCSECFKNYNSL